MEPSRPPTIPSEADVPRPSPDPAPYEPPRIVKKRAVARATQQLFSGTGPTAGGLPAGGGG